MDDYDKLSVLFVTAECVPFCANGGVAEMSLALSKAIAKHENVDIRVVMPLYSKIPQSFLKQFTLVGERTIELSWRKEYCGVFEFELDGIKFYFIDNKRYFDRENLFGYDDDVERFSFFSKAVLDMLPMINFFPDIIHTNDWQTSMVCTFLKVLEWINPKYEHIKSVLTIHNINFQGRADFKVVKDLLGVDEKFAYLFDFFGGANILKASIFCADEVVAVSETYKNEILNTEHGCGLQDVIQLSNHKVHGIINGIDYESYDPVTDTDIFQNFDHDCLELRTQNKTKLQKQLGLVVDENIPLFCFVGFMAEHKGFDLLSQILEKLVTEKNVQFVAVGCGTEQYKNFLSSLSQKYPDKVFVKFGHSSELARKFYAGADFLLNVSSDEPCGLCPLIANRYGCLPIVFFTGGIKDNFSDFKYTNGNGYILKNYDSNSLLDLINRALQDFQNKEKIKNYILSGMEQDFSIEKCAEKYLKLYEEM